jgi:hypothetical protein
VLSEPLKGGTLTTLMQYGVGTEPEGIALDARTLYWANVAGAVEKVRRDGGASITLATATEPIAVAVDATSVYWAEFNAAGNVMKVSPK